MNTLVRSLLLTLALSIASLAYGGVSDLKVTVFDSHGAVAFTGVTDSSGTFVTPTLAPGRYIVQFNSNRAKDPSYALVIAAGHKKVYANGVAGQTFAGGGVAMKLTVESGLNIAGNVAVDSGDGKVLVWVPPMLGTNMPGHWAEKGSADEVLSRTRGIIHRYSLVKMQDHNDRGL